MSGFIYIWFDSAISKSEDKIKRYYIGSHWGQENDGYICSSNWMRMSHKRRPQDFRRKILSRINTSRKDLLLEEEKWLSLIKEEELGIRYYNRQKFTMYNHLNEKGMVSLETRRKQSEAKIKVGKWKGQNNPSQDPDIMRKIISGKTGKKRTEEQKQKMSLAQLNCGRIAWNKGKKGIQVAWNKGKTLSEEHRKNLCKPKNKYLKTEDIP